MAWRISRFSAIWLPSSRAILELIPFTSASRSGSSSTIRKVSAPNFFTILEARAAPIPFMAPEARYRSMAAASSGAWIS